MTVSLLDLYWTMVLIRSFETRVAALYRNAEIPGFVHTSVGQEACAAGVCAALRPDDYLTTTHRGHGHCIAKGVAVEPMMAELFGKATGLCKGKGGSMHVADPRVGILGANAIVAAGLPLAVGAGLSSALLRQERVAVAFFGDGAVNQGMFHEAVNLAAIWSLPVVFVCEDNRYAEFTDSRRMSRVASVAARAAAYGVEAVSVDGNDVEAVFEAASAAVARCRHEGSGPILLELRTYRWHGHYEGDPQIYKPKEQAEAWKRRDPLEIAAARLLECGEADEAELRAVREQAERRVADAVEAARAVPYPAPEELFLDVHDS